MVHIFTLHTRHCLSHARASLRITYFPVRLKDMPAYLDKSGFDDLPCPKSGLELLDPTLDIMSATLGREVLGVPLSKVAECCMYEGRSAYATSGGVTVELWVVCSRVRLTGRAMLMPNFLCTDDDVDVWISGWSITWSSVGNA